MRERPEPTSLEPGAQERAAVARPVRATQHSHVSRFARGDQMSSPETAIALQEARVEPAREAKVHNQHQEKRNETHYCSIAGHGHMGSLETEVVSAWARQGSEVETPARGLHRNHS